MAAPQDGPWSNAEKNYLLLEIIKSLKPPPEVLMQVINNLSPSVRLDDVALPPGRSPNSSRAAYIELTRQFGGAPLEPSTREAQGPQQPYAQPPLKRPYQSTVEGFTGTARILAPKPVTGIISQNVPSSSTATHEQTRRPRGRPRKTAPVSSGTTARKPGSGPASQPLPGPQTSSRSLSSGSPATPAPYSEAGPSRGYEAGFPSRESRPLPRLLPSADRSGFSPAQPSPPLLSRPSASAEPLSRGFKIDALMAPPTSPQAGGSSSQAGSSSAGKRRRREETPEGEREEERYEGRPGSGASTQPGSPYSRRAATRMEGYGAMEMAQPVQLSSSRPDERPRESSDAPSLRSPPPPPPPRPPTSQGER